MIKFTNMVDCIYFLLHMNLLLFIKFTPFNFAGRNEEFETPETFQEEPLSSFSSRKTNPNYLKKHALEIADPPRSSKTLLVHNQGGGLGGGKRGGHEQLGRALDRMAEVFAGEDS